MFSIKCLKHSLISAYGNTAFTADSNPLHASVQMASLSMGPMAFLSYSINQTQFSFISESNNPKATGNIQLWPSRPKAAGMWPFHVPLSAVKSTLR